MATARSKKSGDIKPVEKKQIEPPKVKEVKEALKHADKKDEALKANESVKAPESSVKDVKKELRPATQKAEKSLPVSIEIKSVVSGKRGIGEVIRIDKLMKIEMLTY